MAGRDRPGDSYLWPILPAISLFGVGLVFVVAPITTTALGAIPGADAGVASGINNAVARIAGLMAVAVIPLVAGLTGVDAQSGAAVLPTPH